jgi:hypothetical protein
MAVDKMIRGVSAEDIYSGDTIRAREDLNDNNNKMMSALSISQPTAKIMAHELTLLKNASADCATHGMSPITTLRPTMRCLRLRPWIKRSIRMLI